MRSPSRLYTKDAPAARRIFDPQCKTTFATQSPLEADVDQGALDVGSGQLEVAFVRWAVPEQPGLDVRARPNGMIE